MWVCVKTIYFHCLSTITACCQNVSGQLSNIVLEKRLANSFSFLCYAQDTTCQNSWAPSCLIRVCLPIRLPTKPLHWRHNEHDGVSNHQPHGCLFNRSFGRRSKKTSKLRVTGTGEFPAQRASNTENVFIWWRHHEAKSNDLEWWNDVISSIWLNRLSIVERNPLGCLGSDNRDINRANWLWIFQWA